MPKMCSFCQMAHQVAILVYPGFELLDASGPASVFTAANHALREGGKLPFYAVEIVSSAGGAVASSSGVAVQTSRVARAPPTKVDTLLIVGGEAESVRAVIAEPAVCRWVPRCAEAAARVGSVCSGAFILAAFGLLDGKRAATHWSACRLLADLFPSVEVDPDTLYVADGKVWTSAGVTTGIDMALAMVTRDIDTAIAGHVAKRLVLYARRPGYQSQFSPMLSAQAKAASPFAELIEWMQAHLDSKLDVPTLAARVGLSERSFYRKFLDATGETPARFVEILRVNAARMLLSEGLALKVIAGQVGLSPTSRLTDAFERAGSASRPGCFAKCTPTRCGACLGGVPDRHPSFGAIIQ